jgi:hypothetical protein
LAPTPSPSAAAAARQDASDAARIFVGRVERVEQPPQLTSLHLWDDLDEQRHDDPGPQRQAERGHQLDDQRQRLADRQRLYQVGDHVGDEADHEAMDRLL